MSAQAKGTPSDLNPKSFRTTVITRFAGLFIILGLMFFLPAWTFAYWQAWVYLLILSVPMIFLVMYLYKHDPELLERRMRMREKQKTQKLIVALSWPFFLLAFIWRVPGHNGMARWSIFPCYV